MYKKLLYILFLLIFQPYFVFSQDNTTIKNYFQIGVNNNVIFDSKPKVIPDIFLGYSFTGINNIIFEANGYFSPVYNSLSKVEYNGGINIGVGYLFNITDKMDISTSY